MYELQMLVAPASRATTDGPDARGGAPAVSAPQVVRTQLCSGSEVAAGGRAQLLLPTIDPEFMRRVAPIQPGTTFRDGAPEVAAHVHTTCVQPGGLPTLRAPDKVEHAPNGCGATLLMMTADA